MRSGRKDAERTEVETDVVAGFRSARRSQERMRIVHLARDDLGGAHGVQINFMRQAPDKGTHRRAARKKRPGHGLASLAACTGDQDHAQYPDACLSPRILSELEEPSRTAP